MSKPTQRNYKRNKYLVNKKESDFMHLLQEAVKDKYFVFPQIHLATLLKPENGVKGWQGAFNRIIKKSVDFVLCNKDDYSIVCAIELDDPSHERVKRVNRDAEVELMFEEADLPLLRFETKTEYKIEDIKNKISLFGI